MRFFLVLVCLCPLLAGAQQSVIGQGNNTSYSVLSFLNTSANQLPVNLRGHADLGNKVLMDRISRCTKFFFLTPTNSPLTQPHWTLISLLTNAIPGTCFFLSNGFYNCWSNDLQMPPEVMIVGQSVSNVVLYGDTNTAAVMASGLIMTRGCTIANLSMSNRMCAACYQRTIQVSGDTHDMAIINLIPRADTDNLRLGGLGGNGSLSCYNSHIEGFWDNIYMDSSATETNQTLLLYNCNVVADRTKTQNSSNDGLNGIRAQSGNLFCYFTTFTLVSNGNDSSEDGYTLNAVYADTQSRAAFFGDCVWDNSHTGIEHATNQVAAPSATYDWVISGGTYDTNLFTGRWRILQ